MLFLAKLNVSVTVALPLFYLALPRPSPLSSTLVYFFYYYLCVWVYVLVEGRDSQTLHWWLFSWFIIIKHCNDSFIQLVVTCRWECLYVLVNFCLADLPSAVGEDVEYFQTEEASSANTLAGVDRFSCVAAVLSAKGATQESFTRQGKCKQAFPNWLNTNKVSLKKPRKGFYETLFEFDSTKCCMWQRTVKVHLTTNSQKDFR